MTKLPPDRACELLALNDLEIGAVLHGQGGTLPHSMSTLAGATWSDGNPSLEHRAATLFADYDYANTTNKARALADLGAEGRALLRQEFGRAGSALAGIAGSLVGASLASSSAVSPDASGWEHATEHAVDEVIADLQVKRRRGLSAPGRCLEIYSPWAEVQQTSEGDLVLRLSMLDVCLSEQAVDSLTAALAADMVERASATEAATEAANAGYRAEVDRLKREVLELSSRAEGQRGRAEAAEILAEQYKRETDLWQKHYDNSLSNYLDGFRP